MISLPPSSSVVPTTVTNSVVDSCHPVTAALGPETDERSKLVGDTTGGIARNPGPGPSRGTLVGDAKPFADNVGSGRCCRAVLN
jgi:hypothetical protein